MWLNVGSFVQVLWFGNFQTRQDNQGIRSWRWQHQSGKAEFPPHRFKCYPSLTHLKNCCSCAWTHRRLTLLHVAPTKQFVCWTNKLEIFWQLFLVTQVQQSILARHLGSVFGETPSLVKWITVSISESITGLAFTNDSKRLISTCADRLKIFAFKFLLKSL